VPKQSKIKTKMKAPVRRKKRKKNQLSPKGEVKVSLLVLRRLLLVEEEVKLLLNLYHKAKLKEPKQQHLKQNLKKVPLVKEKEGVEAEARK
jgi:hypothetical protein